MWDAMTAHSVERGMTLDEYIAEAFTKLKEEQLKTQNLEWNTTNHSHKD